MFFCAFAGKQHEKHEATTTLGCSALGFIDPPDQHEFPHQPGSLGPPQKHQVGFV